ncbi:MAG: AraC family transcriptional regulator [Bacteroidia bacterium]|nr:AraC family transcriptional regulator [Bacteroidia bacterium]
MRAKRKKTVCFFSRLFAGTALTPARKTLQIADAHTEICLEKWVGERKYTNPDSTLEDVAEDIGISSLQLAYYFRIVIGQSFQTWRKKLRIRDAQVLIAQNPEKSIASIGYSVGITDKSNFRRQFLEETGMTPIEYRKEIMGIRK